MKINGLTANLLAGLVIAGSAQATIVVGDLSRPNGSNVISDSMNNRQWLGWDVTRGLSYQQTVAAIQGGGQFSGYSIARNLDAQLFVNAMLGANYCVTTGIQNCAHTENNQWELLTGESYSNYRISGFENDIDYAWFLSDTPVLSVGYISIITYNFEPDILAKNNYYGGVADTLVYAGNSNPNSIGWLLFRDVAQSVPEPSTIVLLSVGLLGLLGARRKWKKA